MASGIRQAYRGFVKTTARKANRGIRKNIRQKLRNVAKGENGEDIFDCRDNRTLSIALQAA